MISSELIWIDDRCPRPAALNMAIDEALLMSHQTVPLFRTYRWLSPSVSFGYFSKWRAICDRYPNRELVRRWTGGGAVEHGDDFTYSLILFGLGKLPKAQRLYRILHLCVAETFRELGKPVVLFDGSSGGPSMKCFDRPVAYDVTLKGNKIAGAAIRRLRDRLLLQGSIQQTDLLPDLGERLAGKLGAIVRSETVLPVTIEDATHIANQRYGTDAWTRKF
jgi:lipoyl(octanoyl) transferase